MGAAAHRWAAAATLTLSLSLSFSLSLAACTADRGTPKPRPTPAPTATNAALGDAPPARSVESADFVSPSGNIGCHLDEQGARCDINRRNWKPPPPPEKCDLDWGSGVNVGPTGEATFTCAGDTVLGATETLAYGSTVRAGDFTCTSDSVAMRCDNTGSGHGFTLAIERYSLF